MDVADEWFIASFLEVDCNNQCDWPGQFFMDGHMGFIVHFDWMDSSEEVRGGAKYSRRHH